MVLKTNFAKFQLIAATFIISVAIYQPTLAFNYCAPTSLPGRTGPGPMASVAAVEAAYPTPTDHGYLGNLKFEQIILNGVRLAQIQFDFNPYATPALNDPYFKTLDMRKKAIILVPLQNPVADAFAVSANLGISNGLGRSADKDPLHSRDELAPWWHGTLNGVDFKRSMASVTTDYKVAIGFYDPIPNTIEFQPETKVALSTARQAKSTDQCEYETCSRVLTQDGDIHNCLSDLGHIDSVVIPPSNPNRINSLNLHSGIISAIALKRFIDVSEIVLNRLRAQHYPNLPEFHFERVATSGGSKRGVASQGHLLIDPRVKAAWSGHSNLSNIIDSMAARERVWDHTYYFSGYDSISFLLGRQEWLDRYDRAYYDPSIWVGKTLFLTSGLNDSYFQTGAELHYADALPVNTRYFIQPNYPHGGGSYGHMVIWRNLVANMLNAAPMMQVEAAWDVDANKVYARVSDVVADKVELWCTTGPSQIAFGVPSLRHTDYPECAPVSNNYSSPPPDNRYSQYSKVDMQQQGGHYVAVPPAATGDYAQWQSCVVRAYKGLPEQVETTSKTLHNRAECDINGLNISSTSGTQF